MNYQFGIEEEHFVVNADSGHIRSRADECFMARVTTLSDGAIKPELLQSQIELATPVCTGSAEARQHLVGLRVLIDETGQPFGRTLLAAGTHPTAAWLHQKLTPKDRYEPVTRDMQMLTCRNLICGMHVHVEIPDPDLRIDVMNRAIPFLPLFLALSASSPFWQRRTSGYASYRMTSYQEWPRTGLPPQFATWQSYRGYVDTLIASRIIPDPSYIWWAIRPSSKYPTLELRVCDTCTSIDDAVAIASLYRCLVKFLVENRAFKSPLGSNTLALAKENLWRTQRFGLDARLVDPFGVEKTTTASASCRRLLRRVRRDAESLGCLAEIGHIETILHRGNSADHQLHIFENATAAGATSRQALRQTLHWLLAGSVPVVDNDQVPGTPQMTTRTAPKATAADLVTSTISKPATGSLCLDNSGLG